MARAAASRGSAVAGIAGRSGAPSPDRALNAHHAIRMAAWYAVYRSLPTRGGLVQPGDATLEVQVDVEEAAEVGEVTCGCAGGRVAAVR
eukprot:8570138-Lingulodinium_polyedra.AAC.1